MCVVYLGKPLGTLSGDTWLSERLVKIQMHHYARIAHVDIEQAHRKASPVDNWRLFRFLEGPYADPYNSVCYLDVISLANAAPIDIDKMATSLLAKHLHLHRLLVELYINNMIPKTTYRMLTFSK